MALDRGDGYSDAVADGRVVDILTEYALRLHARRLAGGGTLVEGRWLDEDGPASIVHRAAPSNICADDGAGSLRRPLAGRTRLAQLVGATRRPD